MSEINVLKETIRGNLLCIQENFIELEKNMNNVGTTNDTLEKRKTM